MTQTMRAQTVEALNPLADECEPGPSSARRARANAARTKRRLELTPQERAALLDVLADAGTTAGHARRVRVVLLSAEGVSGVEIARRLQLSVGQVSRIRSRFAAGRVSGLADAPHVGRKDHAVKPALVAHVLMLAASPPPPGRQRWSTRLLAAQVGLTSATIAKILRSHRGSAARAAHERQ